MARENNQKIKLLCLLELLKQETDEEHPMTTAEICSRLEKLNIPCDRRTLSKDIAILNEFGFEVMSDVAGHGKVYYIEDRSFSIPELKIIVDAIQAASFISPRKTDDLIGRIAALGGTHRAELLKGNMVCFNTRKHTNEYIYYSVGYLEEAIRTKRKVSFLYFDLDENGSKIYRKGKERYIVDPMALVYNEDNYYLMCYSEKYDDVNNYRVDRMDNVDIVDESVCDKAILDPADVSDYTEQMFKMYGGSPENIVLEFDRELLGVIYDKFGESTKISSVGENTCIAAVTVQVSPPFWGWLFQFVGKMRILSPDSLADAYVQRCRDAMGKAGR